MMKPIKYHTSV